MEILHSNLADNAQQNDLNSNENQNKNKCIEKSDPHSNPQDESSDNKFLSAKNCRTSEDYDKIGQMFLFQPEVKNSSALDNGPFLPRIEPHLTYTLVIDLDETLVHFEEHEDYGQFFVRPYATEFLEKMAKLYEIVIFTAAVQDVYFF